MKDDTANLHDTFVMRLSLWVSVFLMLSAYAAAVWMIFSSEYVWK
jgi:hypothetical protein